jgi:hypothetical protein
MKQGMTRRELEITNLAEITEILDKSKIVHIAMVDDGEPYMVTMNYGYTMEDGKLTAPKVDNKTQTLLTIPMKATYAKVNFTIEVTPDQTIEGNYSPMFSLYGCTINNAANSVDFDNSTNSDTKVIGAQTCVITGNTEASGANKIKFSFYLPERLLQPATSAEEFKYPFGTNGANIPEGIQRGGMRVQYVDSSTNNSLIKCVFFVKI